ncbi:serine hydrolase domain-containing protein [Lutibacter agarilyticus]|nr:serine hydrolase domain-containing protein [Lutibacter agarilyticus]
MITILIFAKMNTTKKLKKILLAVFCLCLIIGCYSEKSDASLQNNEKQAQKIDSLIKSNYKQELFHGGIVISKYGETIYENYLGIADRTWNIPIQKNVKFDIASLNKSMIAALILKAVEEDKLHLNNKLVALLSNYSFEGSFHPEITIHHLLSHSSGLPDYNRLPEELKLNNFLKFKRFRFSNEEYINFISKIEPLSEPGKQFYYSNFAYHLLAIILEETYKKPFAEILKLKLTKPLGLKNTISESKNEVSINELAKAYLFDEVTQEWYQNPFIDFSLGRRIFSTASDLNRWAQVMDNPGYLKKNSLQLMQQNHLSQISNIVGYGYGWVVFNKESNNEFGNLGINKKYIIHGGSTDGYKAMLININKGEYVISFLSNVGNRTQEMQLSQKIINILIDKKND